jgi:hypothetical protein
MSPDSQPRPRRPSRTRRSAPSRASSPTPSEAPGATSPSTSRPRPSSTNITSAELPTDRRRPDASGALAVHASWRGAQAGGFTRWSRVAFTLRRSTLSSREMAARQERGTLTSASSVAADRSHSAFAPNGRYVRGILAPHLLSTGARLRRGARSRLNTYTTSQPCKNARSCRWWCERHGVTPSTCARVTAISIQRGPVGAMAMAGLGCTRGMPAVMVPAWEGLRPRSRRVACTASRPR